MSTVKLLIPGDFTLEKGVPIGNLRMIALCLGLMVFMLGCDSLFSPRDNPEDKYVNVDTIYRRVIDGPVPYPEKDDVRLCGFTAKSKLMTRIADGVHQLQIDNIKVNFPEDQYNVEVYKIYVLDNAFYPSENDDHIRARGLCFNGISVPANKIRKEEGREIVYVRFDENNVPHYL